MYQREPYTQVRAARIGYDVFVSRVQQIEEQVRTLSGPELRELRAWLDEFESQLWDEQIAADSKAGKLNNLLERALKDEQEREASQLTKPGPSASRPSR